MSRSALPTVCRSAPASAIELARAHGLEVTEICCCSTKPAGGLTHGEVGELACALIRRIRDAAHGQVTVLLVEHHMNLVMSVSDKVVALDFGRKIAEGTPAAVQQNEAVIRGDISAPPAVTRPEARRMLLEVTGLNAFYGQNQALYGVGFSVDSGQVRTLLGANGAGKTTVLRAICGMVRVAGDIHFDGKSIAGWATEDVVRLGVAHVPEGRGTFLRLTVEENLHLGAITRNDKGEVAADIERIYGNFPRLGRARRAQQAGIAGPAASSRCSRWAAG